MCCIQCSLVAVAAAAAVNIIVSFTAGRNAADYVLLCVCVLLSVCLCVCNHFSKIYELILVKFCGGMRRGPRSISDNFLLSIVAH